ncbi:pentapeptide repeat-containing protein, partial [Enterococcus faecalis]
IISDQCIEKLFIEDSIIEHCELSGNNFVKAEFTNCIFKNCDFSNTVLSESVLYKCEFINCKMLGLDISEAYINTNLFLENNMEMVNLS